MTPNFKDAIAIIEKAWQGRKDAPDYPDYDDINTAIYSLEKATEILSYIKGFYSRASGWINGIDTKEDEDDTYYDKKIKRLIRWWLEEGK